MRRTPATLPFVMPPRPATARPSPQLHEALRLYLSGDPLGAEAACRDALRREKSNPRAWHLMGLCLNALGRYADARQHARRGVEIAPDDPELLQLLAMTYNREGRYDEALGVLDTAFARRPDHLGLAAARSEVLFQARRYDEAAAAVEPFLADDPPHVAVAIAFGQSARRVGREEQAVDLLRRANAAPDVPLPQRISSLFILGNLLDHLRRYDEAFAAFDEANRIKGERPDIDEYSASIRRMLDAWTPERIRTLPRSLETSDMPVFIVGMPRSGTTLTEQVLSAHPRFHGAGELRDIHTLVGELQHGVEGGQWHFFSLERLAERPLTRFARRWIERMRRAAPGALHASDKNPQNYLHLGLIWAAFPSARIVHCVRDPLDTCLSCYFHDLGGPHVSIGSLRAIGRWYAEYRTVMRHWTTVLDVPILELRYETMVERPDETKRRLIEFVGLEWHDAVIEHHAVDRPVLTPSVDQVRRPIYKTAVARYTHYEPHLAPLREALAE